MLLPTLRQAVNDPRYSPDQKRAAAEYAARRSIEGVARAVEAGDATAADAHRRARDLARLIASEWGGKRR